MRMTHDPILRLTAAAAVLAFSWPALAENTPSAAPATPPAPASSEALPMPEDLFDAPVPVTLPSPETVVAIVNGTSIKQAMVNEYMNRAIRASGQPIPADREGEIRARLSGQIMEDLVTQLALEQEATAQGMKASDEEVQKALGSIPLPPGMTIDKAIEEQGITRAMLETDVRRALAIDKLLKKQTESIAAPTDEQIKAFYEENKDRMSRPETVTASHILIKADKDADAATKAQKKEQAEKIRKELVDGADFAEAARKYSEDPGSKDKGGEYTFPRGMMVKPFEDAAFAQELNAIGPLVETPFGYHIIKTTAKNAAGVVTLDEAKDRLKTMLERRDKSEAVRKYVEELKAKAKIEYPGRAK